MNVIVIMSILLAIVMLFMSIIVLLSNHRKLYNKIFFILVFFLSGWVVSFALSNYVLQPLTAVKITDIFGVGGMFLFFVFILTYPVFLFRKILVPFCLLIACFIISLFPVIFFTDKIVKNVDVVMGTAIPVHGEIAWLYFGSIYLLAFLGILTLIIKFLYYKKKNKTNKNNISYILFGFGLTAASIAIMIFIAPMFKGNMAKIVDTITPFFSIIFVGVTSYGILKGGLFDVRMAIVRSATYSLSLATMAGIYIGSMAVLSSFLKLGSSTPAELIANVIVSLVLVLLFQPLKRFFDKVTNKIFYRDNYNTEEFFARINQALAVTTDLRELLKKVVKEVTVTLKAEQAFFVVYLPNKEYVLVGSDNYRKLVDSDIEKISGYFSKQAGAIATIALEETDEIKQILLTNKIGVVLPLTSKGSLIGFLCLGEKMSSNYVSRDLEVLNVIANALIIAIQNALAVEEIQDFNITLRQRIDEAIKELRVKNAMLRKLDKAKDDFISMASHQLRTPLTSIKGYISMLADGDAGKISSQQKKILADAYISSDKMVRLVNDFLDVSRLQTGKFVVDRTTVNLMELVKTEVDGLLMVAQKKEIKLSCACHDEVPPLELDENKIRQVVMNFIDNAIFYSHPKSEIKIGLACDSEWVSFTVQDSGIGVPKVEQKELFTKFYRASNAKKQRPSGSGVGLYLAKKVIYAHDGKIIFETIEGKGSTFGFMLPVK